MWQRRQTPLSHALESIDFQTNGTFYKELINIFDGLAKGNAKEIGDHELAQQLPAVIRYHTGLNAVVLFGAAELASASALVNHNNPLLNALSIEEREFLPNADADKILHKLEATPVGRVNLKTGMVSGVFADFPVFLTLPTEVATGKGFTSEEKAAMLLHEIGHLEVYFEFLSRTVSSNQILAALSKKYETSGSIKEREVFLTKVKTLAQLKDLDVEALAKSNDKKVVEVVIVTSIVKAIESELGSNIYDMNSWEQLADQYAARQGAGRALVTALDKAERFDGHIGYRNLGYYLYVEAVKLLFAALAPITYGVTLIPLLVACGADSTDQGGVYDTLKNRMGRVRDQLVEALKDQRLKPEQVASVNQDLTAIDEVLSNVKDRQQLLGYVIDFLSPWHRKRISQEKLQRELERLAHNDLFVRAANLKQFGA
jgi:hypothetical protein